LADLIEDGMGEADRPAVLVSSTEAPDPADARLGSPGQWTLLPENQVDAEMPPDATHVFILLDGRLNPVDQVEALKSWLSDRAAEVARVLCVVNCQLLEKNPKLFAWYEACIHFSDVVLLAQRDGVTNKWISDFRGRFEHKFYPCLFEFVKDGRVRNPALVLAPVARRMSHVFDEQEWIAEDEDDDEDEQEEGEEVEMKAAEDPYFERRNGGRRVHEIPDLADFLPKPGA
jgi:G3E family GTPase